MTIKSILIVLSLALSISINAQEVQGEYHSINTDCKILLDIDAKNNYSFHINGKKRSGTVKIYKEQGDIYLDFGKISSMYDRDTITIQNSGNALNPYLHFEECDNKFIRLVKIFKNDKKSSETSKKNRNSLMPCVLKKN